MSRRARTPYGGRDPREIPAYTIFDAARYLHVPERTIENWAFGYPYGTKSAGRKHTPPLIDVQAGHGRDFSFFNLVELHVLAALRRDHHLQMPKIRRAIDYLQKELKADRPLISHDMETDGTDIFVEKLGALINASKSGQLAMRTLLAEHLRRIERDQRGLAVRLFPFTRTKPANPTASLEQPRVVLIDPAIQFGRPVIAGSRVPTSEVYERFSAGESPNELAADFGRTVEEILEAIRCEQTAAAA